MVSIYSADKVFTGSEWLHDTAIVCEDGIIKEIFSAKNLPEDLKEVRHSFILAPAFIDIQIYGAAAQLFSVYPAADTLSKMNDHCRSGGAQYFLPTIATNIMEVFRQGIDAIKEYWGLGGKGVIGLHVEGPWINKIKRGAHLENLIHEPSVEEVRLLLEYGKGVIKMITLAPEVCTKNIIDTIQGYDVIVSAGHSNATFLEANQAFNNGIKVATHLFNAMTSLHHREPGFAAAVMMHPTVMASIVPDGIHVDFTMIKMAKQLMGDRLFIITDAVTETSEGPYQHKLNIDKFESNGILSGSALSMIKGVNNCIQKCGISPEEALRMASLHPANVLGIDNETGKIQKGFNADFVMLNEEMEVLSCS
ncbi:MAG: N-acetylglucosamine-6-phosphate deacetylase [Bacteroidota bacterium]|nr:N-acetylglucosamine-6-phosphate deacetylase [Bacteroidota bacterium]